MKRVLVVAAHPDDEVLGCGGTVARHAAQGDVVETLIVAQGAAARGAKGAALKSQVEALRAAAAGAAEALGARAPHFLEFPDNMLDTVPLLELIRAIEDHLGQLRPEVVYVHHAGDLNVDHRRIHEAVLTAARPLPGSPVLDIRAFETVSSTEWGITRDAKPFEPTTFIDISDFLETKMRALGHYESEMREFPHARSIDAIRSLAALRGSQVGRTAAEAFICVRSIS